MPGQAPQQGNTDLNVTYHQLVLNLITHMTNARAAGRRFEYASYFTDALLMLGPYLPLADKPIVEADLRALDERIAKIEPKLGAEARKDAELIMRGEFADEHKFYLYRAFERARIISITDEGTLDFTKLDVETLVRVIRNDTGLGSALEGALEQRDGPKAKEGETK